MDYQRFPLLFSLLCTIAWTSWASAVDQPSAISLSSTDKSSQYVNSSSVDSHIQKRKEGSTWSSWSEWSPCSRTCDGGASYQLRKCHSKTAGACTGQSIRYKICNMQPCPEPVDFRAQQCRSFDSIPYEGILHTWEPYNEPTAPCALFCRSKSHNLIVQLAPRVQDGTRCKEGSLDMCINGLCQTIGCDLQLGSDKKIDVCGVCGGDGSSCADTIYQWAHSSRLSPCSASCGGGRREAAPICKNSLTAAIVDDSLCDPALRPNPVVSECNTQPCVPRFRWKVGDWSGCSASCDGGIRSRTVSCRSELDTPVSDALCEIAKPRDQEPCNTYDCPRWYEGAWSGCSASCGEGIQVRTVLCRDARGHPTNQCDRSLEPNATQACSTGIPCLTHAATTLPSTSALPATQSWPRVAHFHGEDPDSLSHSLFDDDEEELRKMLTTSSELPERLPERQPLVLPHPSAQLASRLVVDEKSIPTDPTFIAGEWSPCSATCGEGVKRRDVHCKIFLEFSRTIARLPDRECPGPKPAETEKCVAMPCSLSNSRYEPWIGAISDQSREQGRNSVEDLVAVNKVEAPNSNAKGLHVNYSWKMSGFTQCSASCLGGVQESIIECFRDQDGQRVSPYLCPLDKRPDAITRTCNDIPCPPRWNVSDFSPCSKPCGGGTQTREVHCIHEVARGGGNTLPVATDLCPQPPPRAQQFCNMIDCPIDWQVGSWSKCSEKCGGGHKVRKVTCQQITALGQTVVKASHLCSQPKPEESKPCNPKPCNELTKPKIMVVDQNYTQPPSRKKVTLKIGGQATILKGTQVKIRCPVKQYDKAKLIWMKGHEYLSNTKKFHISNKGILRISDATFSDSGVYSCLAGRSTANITLTVRPVPVHEDQQRPGPRYQTEDNLANRQNVNIVTVKDPVPAPKGKTSGTKGSKKKPLAKSSTTTTTTTTLKPHLNSNKIVDDAEDDDETARFNKPWPILPAGPDDLDDRISFKTLDEDTERNMVDSTDNLLRSHNNGRQRPIDPWDGPLYSDQEQDWDLPPHLTYVTRSPSTTRHTQWTLPATNPEMYQARTSPMPNEPELIEPLPSYWPTNNWWGSVTTIQELPDEELEVDDDSWLYPTRPAYPPKNAKSGGSRPVPSFQLLLAGLQNERKDTSSNHRRSHVPGVIKQAAPAFTAPRETLKSIKAEGHPSSASETAGDEGIGQEVILGKGKPEHLKFEWMLTPWSKCSQTCGGSGFQLRAVQCIVKLHNVTKTVEGGLCEDAGFPAPPTVQNCGLDQCPHWEAGSWTPCEESRCFTWNTALQKRDLWCKLSNGTELDPILCNDKEKPSQKRECFNDNCRGTWKVGDWSECIARCDGEGFQTRLLNCVWWGTNRPAGIACAALPRPVVQKPCRGLPCLKPGECKDATKHCTLAKVLKLCYVPRYRESCCRSCASASFSLTQPVPSMAVTAETN